MSELEFEKPHPLTLEDYHIIKKYIKERYGRSYYLLFVLIAEYGFVASDLYSLKKKNVLFTGEDYIFSTEHGRVTHVPKEMNSELETHYDSVENSEDFFFHTDNNLKIQHSNLSKLLKSIAEKYNIEDLSCRFLSSFSVPRKRINATPVSYVAPLPDKSPTYSVDYCVAFTNLVNQLNNKLLQIEMIDAQQEKENQQKRLLSYMEAFINGINK